MTGKKFRPFSQTCRVKAQRGIRTGLEIVSDRYELHLCHAGQESFPLPSEKHRSIRVTVLLHFLYLCAFLQAADCFSGRFLGCFFFIFSHTGAEVFTVNGNLHPDGLVMIRAFVTDYFIADICLFVLLHQFLQVRFVIVVIVAFIDKVQVFLQMAQDEAATS